MKFRSLKVMANYKLVTIIYLFSKDGQGQIASNGHIFSHLYMKKPSDQDQHCFPLGLIENTCSLLA